MNRDEAHDLVDARLGGTATMAHCLACEACMRALAERLGEDVELWGLTGLVHDLDLDETAEDPERHTVVGAQILRDNGAPEELVQAVLGHNDKASRETRMANALWVVDPTTGMITAAALIRPSKSTRDLKVKSVKKRMKDKRFAAAVNRDQIRACTDLLGLELGDFLQICLTAMDGVRDRIGLGGVEGA
jgi:putative nucleotidyltransferase with HDIG domain